MIMNGNKYYISILNIISCFSVVILHQNYMVHHFLPTREWIFSFILEAIFYFAVPVFFMLTGATLIGFEQRYSNSVFAKKRIKKTVIPFLCFSVFGMFFAFFRGGIHHQLSIKEILIGILDARFTTIYWFFVPLFYIYLLMPILTFVHYLKNNTLLYLIFIVFLLNQLPLLNLFLNEELLFSSNKMFGPLMYVLAGFYLSKYDISLKFKRIIYIVAFSCIVFRILFTCYFSFLEGETNYIFANYFYFSTFFPSISVFLLVKNYTYESFQIRTEKIISNLSSASLGVYLIHFYVITGEHYLFGHVVDATFLYRVISIFITYGICLIVIYITRKIPIIRYVIP